MCFSNFQLVGLFVVVAGAEVEALAILSAEGLSSAQASEAGEETLGLIK